MCNTLIFSPERQYDMIISFVISNSHHITHQNPKIYFPPPLMTNTNLVSFTITIIIHP